MDAVVGAFGGGGLSCGSRPPPALRPETRVWASEIETAAPFSASLAAGRPVSVPHTPSFVDGIGGKSMLPEMWPLASALLAGALVTSVAQAAAAVKLLAERNRVVVEGAAATSVAAALTGHAGPGKIVCVISGGNIDHATLARILNGDVP